ncbi:MAG: DUF5689 domain-containing protein [Bacteroidales bacterium]|jgi:hypothetical protein|nr:DUF5689 domain-containing protein [Bacteroidales bacterium]MCK9448192.1 DUF5689 domain-containing protein [Bacteroidales bacterium]MDD3700928.1 DUF5689 domain-containing protein [Bacteroidales bacterium]MDY0370002.1 DUF5689 domain-containing protein [Bacteroidales bacterium]
MISLTQTIIKKSNYTLILLIAFVIPFIGSCVKQDFDRPPIQNLPIGEVYTIGQLIEQFNTTGATQFNKDASVYGIVTMDETSGNIYRSAYIQDSTGAINLRLKEAGGLRVGDSIRVYLKNVVLSSYNNMRQLDNVHNDSNIIILANQKYRQPETVTLSEIMKGNHQAKLVRLQNVQFIAGDTALTYADSDATTNRMIEDCSGKTMIVRTSNFANFADKSIAKGNGSIVAVVGLFNTTWQLYIRTIAEVQMEGARCGEGGGGGGSGAGTQSDPYNIESAIDKQDASPYIVGWIQGYIVGSVKQGVTSISSADDIHWSPPFTSATNVLVADSKTQTDYTQCVVVNLPAGSPLRAQVNLLDNPDNLKKSLKVTGTLRKYFGIAGLRDSPGQSGDFELEGNGAGGDLIFSEEFKNSLGSFTAFDIDGTQNWHWDNFDGGCAVMAGFASGISYENEDWLISPAINLTSHTDVVLNIRQAANHVQDHWELLQLMVSTDYDGSSNPEEQGSWNELQVPNKPAGNTWTFVDSGDISLAAYEGASTVYIAFRYRSTSSIASTWEISKVIVK